jgi:hypothetical protein
VDVTLGEQQSAQNGECQRRWDRRAPRESANIERRQREVYFGVVRGEHRINGLDLASTNEPAY